MSFSFGSLGELKEDGEDCFKRGLFREREERGEKGEMGEKGEGGKMIFEKLMRRCGEIDYLMGRLKNALERKITKEDVLSPYDRWLGRQMEQRKAEEAEFEEELKKMVKKGKN